MEIAGTYFYKNHSFCRFCRASEFSVFQHAQNNEQRFLVCLNAQGGKISCHSDDSSMKQLKHPWFNCVSQQLYANCWSFSMCALDSRVLEYQTDVMMETWQASQNVSHTINANTRQLRKLQEEEELKYVIFSAWVHVIILYGLCLV